MRPVKATLIKRTTDDGCVDVFDEVPLGRMYIVDLDSKKVVQGYNTIKKVGWEKEIIWDVLGGWLPTELLKIDEGVVYNAVKNTNLH